MIVVAAATIYIPIMGIIGWVTGDSVNDAVSKGHHFNAMCRAIIGCVCAFYMWASWNSGVFVEILGSI